MCVCAAELKVLEQSCHFFSIHPPAGFPVKSLRVKQRTATACIMAAGSAKAAHASAELSAAPCGAQTFPASPPPPLSLFWFHLLEADLCRPGRHLPCLRLSWASRDGGDGLGLLGRQWRSRPSIYCADKCVGRHRGELCFYTNTEPKKPRGAWGG